MTDICQTVTEAMAAIWRVEDEAAFAALMTRLCRIVWQEVRPDPFPADPTKLAGTMIGLKKNDGEDLVRRLLAYDPDDTRNHRQRCRCLSDIDPSYFGQRCKNAGIANLNTYCT